MKCFLAENANLSAVGRARCEGRAFAWIIDLLSFDAEYFVMLLNRRGLVCAAAGVTVLYRLLSA